MRAARCLKSSSVVPSKRVKVRERERERERDNLFALLDLRSSAGQALGSLIYSVSASDPLHTLYLSILGWTRTDRVGSEKKKGGEKVLAQKILV